MDGYIKYRLLYVLYPPQCHGMHLQDYRCGLQIFWNTTEFYPYHPLFFFKFKEGIYWRQSGKPKQIQSMFRTYGDNSNIKTLPVMICIHQTLAQNMIAFSQDIYWLQSLFHALKIICTMFVTRKASSLLKMTPSFKTT